MTVMSAYSRPGKYNPFRSRTAGRSSGFTLLEMVVVLVLLGVVSSLAYPGLQRMYDSVNRALFRDEVDNIFNNLSLSVQTSGKSLLFSHYPEQADQLPPNIAARLEQLGVEVVASSPVFISASGFCPAGAQLAVSKGLQDHTITLRSPDCKVME